MKKLTKGILISFLLSILGIVLQVPPAASIENNQLRVVYTNWYPYTYEENGRAAGFEIDTFKAVINTMGLGAEFKLFPWKRCLNRLKNGSADVLISMLKTPEREQYTYYPETCISISQTMLFTTSDRKITFSGSYNDLMKYSIGIMKGFSYGEAFDAASDLNKDFAFDTRMLIKKLIAGRNDIAIGNQAVINAAAFSLKVQDKIQFLSPPIHTKRLYVGFSKIHGLEALSVEFSNKLSKFKTSGSYKKILEQYGIASPEMVETITYKRDGSLTRQKRGKKHPPKEFINPLK